MRGGVPSRLNRVMRSFIRVLVIIAVAIVLPRTALAQVTTDTAATPKQTVFAYVQLGDTIAIEAVYTDSGVVRGAYFIPKQGRIGWNHQLKDDGTPGMLTLSFFPPPEQGDRVFRQIDYDRKADSMFVLLQDYEGRRGETVATRDSAIAVFGRSLAHIAYLGYYAVLTRQSSLPLYLVSSGKTVAATVSVLGEALIINVDGLRVEATWQGGALVEVNVPSQSLTVRRLSLQ